MASTVPSTEHDGQPGMLMVTVVKDIIYCAVQSQVGDHGRQICIQKSSGSPVKFSRENYL